MHLELKDIAGGKTYRIGESGALIGRKGPDVVIDDPKLGDPHARIFWGEGHFYLEALPSEVGVVMYGKRLTAKVELRIATRFQVGEHRFEVSALDAKAAAPALASPAAAVKVAAPLAPAAAGAHATPGALGALAVHSTGVAPSAVAAGAHGTAGAPVAHATSAAAGHATSTTPGAAGAPHAHATSAATGATVAHPASAGAAAHSTAPGKQVSPAAQAGQAAQAAQAASTGHAAASAKPAAPATSGAQAAPAVKASAPEAATSGTSVAATSAASGAVAEREVASALLTGDDAMPSEGAAPLQSDSIAPPLELEALDLQAPASATPVAEETPAALEESTGTHTPVARQGPPWQKVLDQATDLLDKLREHPEWPRIRIGAAVVGALLFVLLVWALIPSRKPAPLEQPPAVAQAAAPPVEQPASVPVPVAEPKETSYQAFLRKRDEVESFLAEDPVMLKRVEGALVLYQRLHEETAKIDKKKKKKRATQVDDHLREAELFERTGPIVEELHTKLSRARSR